MAKPAPTRILFQTVSSIATLERTDHVWYEIVGGKHDGRWKCCLCGGITSAPPSFPTKPDWVPEDYELPLTEVERRMCQNSELKR